MATPLEFHTQHDGQPITIDGQPYLIKHPDRLSLGEIKRLERVSRRAGPLMQADDLSLDQEQELSSLLSRFSRSVLDAPPDVEARLFDMQRIAIMQAFMRLRSTLMPTTAPAAGATVAPAHPEEPAAALPPQADVYMPAASVPQ